ncbi:MAG TPA: glycosyltransferase family 1 protein [Thermoprotei archaeon]|nr:glycosyltransferase family 1 protein [Thermoprotei archaeon]
MKVVLSFFNVYPFHGKGGVEKYPYYFAKSLSKAGVDVEIVTSTYDGKSRVEFYDGIKYVLLRPKIRNRKLTMNLTHPWADILSLNLARYLKKQDFDILHSYGGAAYFYLRYKDRRPVVVQPFGLEPWTAYHSLNFLQKIYLQIFMRYPWKYCITHANAIASEGAFINKQIIKLFDIDKNKIFNLPIGVDIESIKKQIEDEKVSRSELGLSEDDFIIISVNRFIPIKGLDYLVDAFSIVKQYVKEAKLILIGSMTYPQEVKTYEYLVNKVKKYNLSNDVIFKPNLPEDILFKYYSISDIYVSPTLQDDFIISIAEAMVCGLPVVSTGQEFLVKNGVNGCVIPKRNAEKLAEAILKIYCSESKRHIMGKHSQKIVEEYDWSNIAKIAIKKYENLLKK